MSLEISLDVDAHCRRKLLRVSKSEGAIVGFVWLDRLDSGGVEFIDCFNDRCKNTILTIIYKSLENLLVLGLMRY